MFKNNLAEEKKIILCHDYVRDMYGDSFVTVSVTELANNTDYANTVADKRLDLISLNTKEANPLALYLTYYKMFCNIANDRLDGNTENNMFAAHLELGYVPVCAGPTDSLGMAVYLLGKKRFLDKNIPYIEVPAMKPDGTLVSAQYGDIWVSKMTIGNFMNVKPDQVKLGKFILEVLR